MLNGVFCCLKYVRFKMKYLEMNEVNRFLEFLTPIEEFEISMSSPATLFLNDFTKTEPLTVEASMSADLARLLMLKAHKELALVVDSNNTFMGTISVQDVSDQRITAELSKSISRESILVSDLMVSKAKMKGFKFSDIEHADIESVIYYLKEKGQQQCLVLDDDTDKVRGIFSVNEISKKLGTPINVEDKTNFYRVFSALA